MSFEWIGYSRILNNILFLDLLYSARRKSFQSVNRLSYLFASWLRNTNYTAVFIIICSMLQPIRTKNVFVAHKPQNFSDNHNFKLLSCSIATMETIFFLLFNFMHIFCMRISHYVVGSWKIKSKKLLKKRINCLSFAKF